PVFGGFDAWAQIVGGVLAYAGVKGFLHNLDHMYETADEESEQWIAFLSVWRDTFGENPITTAQVSKNASDHEGEIGAHLPEDPLRDTRDTLGHFTRRLGKALARKVGTRFDLPGGGQVWLERVKDDSHAKVAQWRVVCSRLPTGEGEGNAA